MSNTVIPDEVAFDPSLFESPSEIARRYAAAFLDKDDDEQHVGGKRQRRAAAGDDGDAAARAPRAKRKKKAANTMMLVKGVPPSVTDIEVEEWARRAGVVKRDVTGEKTLIKRLDGEQTTVAVAFLYKESLQQAELLLDETPLGEAGAIVRVDIHPPAHLTQKQVFGDAMKAAAVKGRRALDTNTQRRVAGSWEEEGEFKRHVVIFNLFDPKSVDPSDVLFYDELKRDLVQECTQKCGAVEVLKVFEHSPLGACVVKFKQEEAAARCVALMHGRFFDGRELRCEYYDGFTNYAVKEDAESRAKRDEGFAQWLEGGGDDDEE